MAKKESNSPPPGAVKPAPPPAPLVVPEVAPVVPEVAPVVPEVAPQADEQDRSLNEQYDDKFAGGTDLESDDPLAAMELGVEENEEDMKAADIESLMFEFDKSADIALFKSTDFKRAINSLANLVKVSGKDVFYKTVWFETVGLHIRVMASDGIASGRRIIPFHEIHNNFGGFAVDFKQLTSVVNFLGYIFGLEKTETGVNLRYKGGETSVFTLAKNDIQETWEGYETKDILTVIELFAGMKFARTLASRSPVPDLTKVFISGDRIWSFDGKGYSSFSLTKSFFEPRGFLLRDVDVILKFFEAAKDNDQVTISTSGDKVMFSVTDYGDLVVQSFTVIPSIDVLPVDTEEVAVMSLQIGLQKLLSNFLIALRTREVAVADINISDRVINLHVKDLKGGVFNSDVAHSAFTGTPMSVSVDLERVARLLAMLASKTESQITIKLYDNMLKVVFENKVVATSIVKSN